MNRRHTTYAVTALTGALVTACLLFTPSSSAQYGTWSNWSINGNVNINSKRHFLGTVSDAPVIFKTSNRECMRLTGQGDAIFKGSLDIGGDVSLGGDLVVRNGNVGIGTEDPLARLHIKGESDFRGEHIAFFESTSNVAADGIAIQLDNPHTNSENNFVTFYNGDGVVTGRIEGYDLEFGDWQDPPPIPDPLPKIASNIFWNPGRPFRVDDWDDGVLPSINFASAFFNAGRHADLDWTSGVSPTLGFPQFYHLGLAQLVLDHPLVEQEVLPRMCWAIENDMQAFMQTDPVALATEAVVRVAAEICKDEGVTFGSHGADYAEWLPKVDPEEHLQFGDIVGVFGGKVSRKTSGADRVMAVSAMPVVLGNMPPEGESYKYEKIGFMGQLPIVVRGKVKTGDYIIASGYEDGTGIAIKPDELTAGQLPFVVGRAWADSKNDLISLIQVVISPPSTESFHVIQQQQHEIDELRAEMKAKEETIEQIRQQVQELTAVITQLQK